MANPFIQLKPVSSCQMSPELAGLALGCVVWCRRCEMEKYRVYRKPIDGREGIFENVRDPEPEKEFMYKCSTCGGPLERT